LVLLMADLPTKLLMWRIKPLDERTSIMNRLFLVLGLILLIPCALGFQLVRINFFEGEQLRKLWSKQAIDYIPIPARRGNIYDTNGTLLATNSVEYQVSLDPKVEGFNQQQKNKLISRLSELTRYSKRYFERKIENAPTRSRYIVLAKGLSIIQKDEIKALDIHGVILEEKYKRKYTFNTLAAHILGFVNNSMDGQIGLESFYNKQLKGIDGQQQVRRDANNNIFEYIGAPKKLPRQGYSLQTTIDAYVQAILEDELKAGVERTKSNYGIGIILDPRTGAIKAMANYPSFNPNAPGSSENENRRNFAISDMMEPGSTFKLVTAVSAVEQGKVELNEVFETGDGKKEIFGLTIRDHDPLGTITFEEVIQKSSNVATAEIALRLEPNIFFQYVRNFGFGTPTNIDLSGEVDGQLSKPFEWSKVTLPYMAHGYEILATPIQIAQAYAAFANNGIMMKPYLVDRIIDTNGGTVKEHRPEKIRRVAHTKTIKKLLPVFESVVADSGTANWAYVEGLPVAGKTGTAKKVVDGRYQNKYRASFVGFFPADDPRYVCYILLDEPKTSIYGGYTAGPIFRQTATRIAGLDSDIQRKMRLEEGNTELITQVPSFKGLTRKQALSILSELNLPYTFEGNDGFIISQSVAPGNALQPNQVIKLNLSETITTKDSETHREGYVVIPDLKNISMRQAALILNSKGLKVKTIGSGTVFTQFPKQGSIMRKGRTVTVRGRAKAMDLLTQAGGEQ